MTGHTLFEPNDFAMLFPTVIKRLKKALKDAPLGKRFDLDNFCDKERIGEWYVDDVIKHAETHEHDRENDLQKLDQLWEVDRSCDGTVTIFFNGVEAPQHITREVFREIALG